MREFHYKNEQRAGSLERKVAYLSVINRNNNAFCVNENDQQRGSERFSGLLKVTWHVEQSWIVPAEGQTHPQKQSHLASSAADQTLMSEPNQDQLNNAFCFNLLSLWVTFMLKKKKKEK